MKERRLIPRSVDLPSISITNKKPPSAVDTSFFQAFLLSPHISPRQTNHLHQLTVLLRPRNNINNSNHKFSYKTLPRIHFSFSRFDSHRDQRKEHHQVTNTENPPPPSPRGCMSSKVHNTTACPSPYSLSLAAGD